MPDALLALAHELRTGWGWSNDDGGSIRAGTVHAEPGMDYPLRSPLTAMVRTQAFNGAQLGIVFELAEAAAHALQTLPIFVRCKLARPSANTFIIPVLTAVPTFRFSMFTLMIINVPPTTGTRIVESMPVAVVKATVPGTGLPG